MLVVLWLVEVGIVDVVGDVDAGSCLEAGEVVARSGGALLLALFAACVKVSGGEARKLASCRVQLGAPAYPMPTAL